MFKSILALCVVINIANACLVADKPIDILQCISISPQALVSLLSGGDLKSFCQTANTYISCLKTFVEDCVGGKVAIGALDELNDLNKKCCISSDTSKCVTKNPDLVKNCFAADNLITLDNNMKKTIMDVQVGDIVKAIDSNGNIMNSEVIAILHKNSDEITQFYNFIASNGQKISLTAGHLISIKNKGYIKASTVKVGDIMSVFSEKENNFVDSAIVEIEIELKKGYIAPLTQTGTILVNNVHASCYAEINSHWIADLAMQPMKLWYKFSKYFGMNEINSEDGLHIYATVLQQFTEKLLPSLFA